MILEEINIGITRETCCIIISIPQNQGREIAAHREFSIPLVFCGTRLIAIEDIFIIGVPIRMILNGTEGDFLTTLERDFSVIHIGLPAGFVKVIFQQRVVSLQTE